MRTRALLTIGILAAANVWSSAGEPEDVPMVHLDVDARAPEHTISRFIYGHFAEHLGGCIYGGIWVGEDSAIPNTRGIRRDVVEAMRAVKAPVLRWPGGCFASEYHWRDGIGPREDRPLRINTFWGQVPETNAFGTHEFFDLCDQIGCEPYLAVNMAGGTVQEMTEWLEYITFDGDSTLTRLRKHNGRADPWRLKYLCIGNESWGPGGFMRPQYYVDVYKRYQAFVRNFGESMIYKVACGPYDENDEWVETLMSQCMGRTEWGRVMDGFAPHYYSGSGTDNRSATKFGEEDWFGLLKNALRTEELLEGYEAIMDKHDPDKEVSIIFDEWGACHQVEEGTNPRFCYQQSTLRDALVAGIHFNIFNNHCERVHMANVAQMANVLQALILTQGPAMVLTPTYHVFRMYTVHHDAALLPSGVQTPQYRLGKDAIPAVTASFSRNEQGIVHASLCNLDPHRALPVVIRFKGFIPAAATGKILTAPAMTTHNTFEEPEALVPAPFSEVEATGDGTYVQLPAKSVVVLRLESGDA